MSDEMTKKEIKAVLDQGLGHLNDYQLLVTILDLEQMEERNPAQKATYEWLCTQLVERNMEAVLQHNGIAWSPYTSGHRMTLEEIDRLPTFLDSAKALVWARVKEQEE